MKFWELEKLIKEDGWKHIKTKGSHYQYKHPTKKGKVTIPFHGTGSDVDKKTVESVKKQAGL